MICASGDPYSPGAHLMDEECADVPLPAWAATLPPPVAKIVRDADLARPHLYLPMPAKPARLRPLRERVSDWAAAIGHDRREDIVLAVDEAAANSIEHAYRDSAGLLTVFAGSVPADGKAYIVVSDRGDWRVPPPDPGYRGRGLAIMHDVAPVFDLHHDQRGTTVVLGWPQPF